MTKFTTLNLPELLNNSLKRMKYETATPIQAKAIPLAMQGHDILGSAQTGTGKTAAFAIPLINYLIENQSETGIVLTPTRELAVQVIDIIRQLVGPKKSIRSALLIGGAPIQKQLEQLKRRPRIIVGTPGRINDHIARKRLQLDRSSFLVLDETDRMLDMGFGVQIDEILRYMPKKRQTLLFSATLPKSIQRVAAKYLKDPERVAIGSTTDVAKNVSQEMIRVKTADKYDMLLSQVANRQGSMIIFVKTKRSADKMAERLRNENFKANAIHGDLRQRQRDRVIKQFREKKYRILVATDVAARGLDIPHIEHVINYNLPQCPEDYIHRIGRTARAGKTGEALCIVSPDENSKWNAINRMLDPNTAHDGGTQQNGNKQNRNNNRKRRKPFDKKRKPYKNTRSSKSKDSSYEESRGYGQRKSGQARLDGKKNFEAGKRRREEGRRARDGEERSHAHKKREFNPARSENRGNSNGGRGRDFNKNRDNNTEKRSFNGQKRSFSGKANSNPSKSRNSNNQSKLTLNKNRKRNDRSGNQPQRRRNAA